MARNRERIKAEMIREFDNIVRPIEKRPPGFRIRNSVSGPLGDDQPNTRYLCKKIILRKNEPGTGCSVEEEQGAAVWIA
jgi:hypothetical protein